MTIPATEAMTLALAIQLGGADAKANLEVVAGVKSVVLTLREESDDEDGLQERWRLLQATYELPPLRIRWRQDKGAAAPGSGWRETK